MPTPCRRNSNPDARPTTGGQRRREAGWRADDRAQAESNREHERRRREVKKAGRPRKVQPSRRRAPLPLDLLASALEAGVSQRQIAQDLGISRFDLNRALERGGVPGAAEHLLTIRRGYDGGQERQRDCRRLLQRASVGG